MRAAPVSPPPLHSIYMMRPACAFDFRLGGGLRSLLSDDLVIAFFKSTVFPLGDFGIQFRVTIVCCVAISRKRSYRYLPSDLDSFACNFRNTSPVSGEIKKVRPVVEE